MGQCPVQYQPAPLDVLSWENGVAKYVHPQRTVDVSFYDYAEAVLDKFFPNMQLYSKLRSEEYVISMVTSGEHAGKASGFPWNYQGSTTKKDSYEKYGDTFAACPFHILSATLKDELRPTNKDSRLFRMQATHDYMEGMRLFDVMNDFFASRKIVSPAFICYVTPGVDVSLVYETLVRFGGGLYDADGSAWDANFPLFIAEFLCYWRSRFFSLEDRKRIKHYYRNMYNGFTNVAGYVLHMVGQSSGHFNTTTDNSLGNIVAMSYVAYKNGLSVNEFTSQVKFFVCGDDLVWSNRTIFTPTEVGNCYADIGIYLEFGSLEPSAVQDITFVGTLPVIRDRIRYHGRLEKLQASCYYRKKKHTVRDTIAKLCSITAMSFYSEYYQTFYDLTYKYLSFVGTTQPHWLLDLEVASSLRTIQFDVLTRLYNQWESSFSNPTASTMVLKDVRRHLKRYVRGAVCC